MVLSQAGQHKEVTPAMHWGHGGQEASVLTGNTLGVKAEQWENCHLTSMIVPSGWCTGVSQSDHKNSITGQVKPGRLRAHTP